MSQPQQPQSVRVRRKPKLSLAVLIPLIGIMLTIGVLAALNQSIPATTVPPQTVSSSCSSIVTTTVLTPNSGAVQYTCTGGTQAFNTIAGVSTPLITGYTSCPATVTSPCYTEFGYVPHGDTTSCAPTTGSGFHQITQTGTTQQLTFTAGAWDYCAVYAAPSTGGSLPGFSIGWS